MDEKRNYVKLHIDSLDDLWTINNILEKNDIVYGITFRREETRDDSIRSKKTERIKLKIGIEVNKIEFQEFTDRLRINGKIVDGPEDYIGSMQTLSFQIGDDIEIIKKEWNGFFIKEIERAVNDSIKPKVIFLSMDDEYATIALMHNYGIEEIAEIRLNRQHKDFDENTKDDFGEIVSKLKQYWDGKMPIVVLGPGFTKNNFINYLDKDMLEKVMVVDTSYGSMRGIFESIKSGTLDKLIEKQRVAVETKLISDLLEEIGKNGKYAYGIDQVKRAIENGAVEKLLVLDKKMKEKDIMEMMKDVERMRGEIYIISSFHEYGKILKNLGGIAALLRYRVD